MQSDLEKRWEGASFLKTRKDGGGKGIQGTQRFGSGLTPCCAPGRRKEPQNHSCLSCLEIWLPNPFPRDLSGLGSGGLGQPLFLGTRQTLNSARTDAGGRRAFDPDSD